VSRGLQRFALAALLTGVCGLPVVAQEPKEAPKKEDAKSGEGEEAPKSGRRPFKRDQGTAAALEGELKAVLAELKKRYPDWRYDANKAGTPVGGPSSGAAAPKGAPKKAGGGLQPPPKKGPVIKGPKGERSPEEIEKDTLLKRLRAWRPTKEAVIDVMTVEGVLEIGKATYKVGKRTFGPDEPKAIAENLGIHPSLTEVKVYQATTEELQTMEFESVSATEFASGLRGVAMHLKPRYQFYVVTLDRSAEEKKKAPMPKGAIDTVDARLQLFAKSGGSWIYVGRIWRLEKDLASK
jgi:hypothetical protein